LLVKLSSSVCNFPVVNYVSFVGAGGETDAKEAIPFLPRDHHFVETIVKESVCSTTSSSMERFGSYGSSRHHERHDNAAFRRDTRPWSNGRTGCD